MSRSEHHGCGAKCGLCHPQKKWKHQISRIKRMKVSDMRRWYTGNKRDRYKEM